MPQGKGSLQGRLIVFEGGEGSGKTTQLKRLSQLLSDRQFAHSAFREPGGTALGAEVRRMLLDPGSDVDARAEALLFIASRAQLVSREIRPRLDRGELVLLDRFFLSTYAYQIGGHHLPEADVRAANHLATGGLIPDITFLLSFPSADGLIRAGNRTSHDRMEAMGPEFHDRVSAALAMFSSPQWQASHRECGRIVTIDATGSEGDVAAKIETALNLAWPGFFQRTTE